MNEVFVLPLQEHFLFDLIFKNQESAAFPLIQYINFMTKKIVYWFRNDLRLHDNEAFYKATREADEVIPVYIFDPRMFGETAPGINKYSIFQAQFLIESVTNLKDKLQKNGADLLIRIGHPEKIVAELAEHYKASYVFSSKEIAPEETSIESSLSKQLKTLNVDIDLIWLDTLCHPHDLPFPISKLPGNFETFRQIMEKGCKVRDTFAVPAKIKLPQAYEAGEPVSLSDLGYEPTHFSSEDSLFRGGEDAGLSALADYLNNEGNESPRPLSPWLALGCLSPRHIFNQLRIHTSSSDIRHTSLLSELRERDYHHFTMLRYGNRLFKLPGVAYDVTRHWLKDKSLFDQWQKGETGNKVVDQIIRELRKSGYISAEQRKVAAQFLALDLKVNWTWGAAFFESHLIDYDVCINWASWNHYAGVGQLFPPALA